MGTSPALSTAPAADTGSTAWVAEHHEGRVILRRDGASDAQPENWRDLLLEALDAAPRPAVVGAKRLAGDGKVMAMGEHLIHPKGFHHVGKGMPGEAYRFAEEVDAIVGGVVALRDEDYDEADWHGALGGATACLALRQRGARVFAVPQVVVTDEFTPRPTADQTRRFAERFGFDWQAADLDAVRREHPASGLLWNQRFHSVAMPFEKYRQRPAVHWTNYQKVQPYRQRADHIAGMVRQLIGTCGPAVLDLGCGDGLFSHLFALAGGKVTGIDPEAIAIEQARAQIAAQTYAAPNQPPTLRQAIGDDLPFEAGSFNVVAMLDVIEHLPNPVAVLREVSRVLAPGGALVITTPGWQYGTWSDATYHLTEYTLEELVRQVQAAAAMPVVNTGSITGIYRDLIVITRKPESNP